MLTIPNTILLSPKECEIDVVRRPFGRSMGGENGPAARDRRNKARRDFPSSHMADQGVDRRLPFRIAHFLRNAFVGDDAPGCTFPVACVARHGAPKLRPR